MKLLEKTKHCKITDVTSFEIKAQKYLKSLTKISQNLARTCPGHISTQNQKKEFIRNYILTKRKLKSHTTQKLH